MKTKKRVRWRRRRRRKRRRKKKTKKNNNNISEGVYLLSVFMAPSP